MMESLEQLHQLLDGYFWHGFIIFLRVGATVSVLPGFGAQTIPMRIRLITALAFTAVIAPAIEPITAPTNTMALIQLVGTETLTGLLIGIGVRLMLMALQTAGTIAAQSTSLSQILGGSVPEPLAAIGYILTMGALALLMITGFHIKIAISVIETYQIFPIGVWARGDQVSQWGVRQVSQAFELAFLLSAPFILVSVLYNLTLGAINKAMPQLMVAFVGAPLITFGGLFLLFLTSPILLSTWQGLMDVFLANPFEVTP